ncbi:MAG: hypothetical protein QNL15_13360 [Pseudomonadales bacterium]|jgi:hypothetical protein|tara:strand:- start:890 stop:1381 length:492 start_codon:yes stop_codon:yes gene_type:complete
MNHEPKPSPDLATTIGTTPENELATEDLSCGAQLFIWSLRHWLVAIRMKQPPPLAMREAYLVAGCVDATILVDELMCLVGVASKRRIEIRCCCRKTLSQDEMLLLSCMRLLQQDESQKAADLLGALMMPALSRSVCRVADQYRVLLKEAGLSLIAPAKLKVVL